MAPRSGTEADDRCRRERATGTGAADSGEWPNWKGGLDSTWIRLQDFDDPPFAEIESVSEREVIDSVLFGSYTEILS